MQMERNIKEDVDRENKGVSSALMAHFPLCFTDLEMVITSFAARPVREHRPDVNMINSFYQTSMMDMERGQRRLPRAQTTRWVWVDEARLRSGQEHVSG